MKATTVRYLLEMMLFSWFAAAVFFVGVLAPQDAAAGESAFLMPSIFGNDMVLQRETDAPVWGWDDPGKDIVVSFRGMTAKGVAGKDGKWSVRIATGAAGGPFTMKIAGSRTVEFTDVMVGEVWVAGGQSNMWWHVGNCKDLAREKKEAKLPGIRMWDATNTSDRQAGWRAAEPQRTVKAQWVVTSPETVGDFPGTAYFFAKELHKRLKVPVGIVHIAVPGTDIEMHLSSKFVETNLPQTTELRQQRGRTYAEDMAAYRDAHAQWEIAKKDAAAKGLPLPQEPAAPEDPATPYAGAFYNGMVMPCAPFAAKGFLWWQGENNAARWMQYREMFPGLIQEWRRTWQLNDAPFLFAELHGWLQVQTRPVEEDAWPNLRDAQRAALRLKGVYEICTLDILDPSEGIWQIHPGNKQLAGLRFCLAAMANVYGEKGVAWSGPVLRSAEICGPRVVLHFDHAGDGLAAQDGKKLAGFAIAGADQQFVWADAKIEGETVVVTGAVQQPVAVRYGWANNPTANLANKAGFPAFPFRTDAWNLGQ